MSETKKSIEFKLKKLGIATETNPAVFEDTVDVQGAASLEGTVAMTGIPTYANDGAAGSGGLVTGDLFILTATAAVTVKA